MMTNYALNENSYLQNLVDDHRPIFCWLANGIRLVGFLEAHDTEAIFIRCLESKNTRDTMMVMKQQITSIVTIAAASLYRSQENPPADKKVDKPNAKRRTCPQGQH
jgi:sRNA-binding regulator protein Hfq